MSNRSALGTAVVLALVTVAFCPAPAGAITSSPAWQNTPVPAQTESFTVEFDATPNAANMDGVTALSAAAASGYNQCAILVRFNSSGQIDARNGGSYGADAAIAYTPGTNYRFRIAVDMEARTYSVFVTPAGGAEQALASDYAFRSEQAGATHLANWAVIAEPGTHTISNFRIVTDGSEVPGTTSTPAWQNTPMAAQSGSFTAEFDATPNAANMDGVTALSTAAASGYNQCAVLVRFNSSGQIDVRNGGSYSADAAIAYTPGTSYHFRLAVNVPARTYSVYVTPAGGSAVALASNYAFRSEQAGASSLANCAIIAEPGTHTIRNFRVAGGTTPTPPRLVASAGADKTLTAGQSTTLSGSASGGVTPYTYLWSPTTGLSSATVATPTASPVATTTYTLTVRDAASQTASDSVVITVNMVIPPLVANAGADKTIVAGESTSLAGSASGGTPPYTYSWTPTTGLSSASVATPTASPTATTTYTLTVKDAASRTATDSVVVTVAPPPGQTSTSAWQNFPFTAQSGTFTAEFDTVPNAANMDGVTALSSTAASGYNQCPVLVRFNPNGQIDARNGDSYGADATVSYAAGKSYHFRLVVNVPGKTYSVHVTPAGGTEQTLASNYAFRTEAAAATSLANWAMIAEPGTHTVSNFKIGAAPLAANAGADKNVASGGSVTLDGSASGGTAPYTYAWSPSTGLSSTTIARPSASPTATTTYTLTVRDVTGQTATDSVVVTVGAATPLTANAGSDKSITAGQSTTLTGSASGGKPPYTYAWTPTTGLATPNAATTTAAPLSTQTYTLTVTDAAGAAATDITTVTVGSVSTATYYVATNGNDGNPGTSSAPWRTLAKAASTAQAGHTVIVRSGTYYETLTPAYSGQAGKLVTFKSETPRGAVLDGQNSRSYGTNLRGRTYVRIEGFEIRYFTQAGVYLQGHSDTTTYGVEIVNNYIHHNGDYTGWSGSSGQGIQASNARNSLFEGNEIYYNGDTAFRLGGSGDLASNLTIRYNNVHYNGRDGISGTGINLVIEYNKFHNQCHTSTHQDGLQFYSGTNIIFRYNIMGDFTQLVYGGMNGGDPNPFVNLQVYGNVFYNHYYNARKGGACPAVYIDCRNSNQNNKFQTMIVHSNTFLYLGDGFKAILFQGASGLQMNDVRIYNNIFYQCRGTMGGQIIEVDSRFSNFYCDYNTYYNCSAPSGKDSHSIFADPQFVNYTRGALTFDARLKSTSPCINKGPANLGSLVPLPADFCDMNGKPRPSGGGFDMGAYEQ